jgi:hypothetical protein
MAGTIRLGEMNARGRTIRRFITRVIIFLLLGAIVNVAVAWGVAVIAGFDVNRNAVRLSDDSMRKIVGDRFGSSVAANINAVTGGVQRQSCRSRLGVLATMPEQERFIEVWEYGFPFMALASEQRGQYDATEPYWSIPMPAVIAKASTYPRQLPLRPVAPSFTINTLFYAGILWLLFAAAFALRRRRRLKHGLCRKCGYDLRGQAVGAKICPECGANA